MPVSPPNSKCYPRIVFSFPLCRYGSIFLSRSGKPVFPFPPRLRIVFPPLFLGRGSSTVLRAVLQSPRNPSQFAFPLFNFFSFFVSQVGALKGCTVGCISLFRNIGSQFNPLSLFSTYLHFLVFRISFTLGRSLFSCPTKGRPFSFPGSH